jgi:hypothetical protein
MFTLSYFRHFNPGHVVPVNLRAKVEKKMKKCRDTLGVHTRRKLHFRRLRRGIAPGRFALAGHMQLVGIDLRLKSPENQPVTMGAMGAQYVRVVVTPSKNLYIRF